MTAKFLRPTRRVAITLGAMLAAVALIAGAQTDGARAQVPAPPITGEVPTEGVALLVAQIDVTPQEAGDWLRVNGCDVTVLAVASGGHWVLMSPAAPNFTHAPFEAATQGGVIVAGRGFVAFCAPRESGFVLEAATGAGTGGFATQIDARVATHADFDRLVLEFDEDVIPAYEIAYATAPQFTCGAGTPVAVEGGATLVVRLSGARVNNDAGELAIPTRTIDAGLSRIREVREICAFEGQVTWLVGLDEASDYRLTLMQTPARVVLDLPHADCENCVPLGATGLAGAALAGPQCPVVQAEEDCPDRLADAAFTVTSRTSSMVSFNTGSDGNYLLPLPPGDYQIVRSDPGLPSAAPRNVTVPAAGYVWEELSLDTGIR